MTIEKQSISLSDRHQKMTAHLLTIAKASFSAGLLRPDPTSVPRDDITLFHDYLARALSHCSSANIQVWSVLKFLFAVRDNKLTEIWPCFDFLILEIPLFIFVICNRPANHGLSIESSCRPTEWTFWGDTWPHCLHPLKPKAGHRPKENDYTYSTCWATCSIIQDSIWTIWPHFRRWSVPYNPA